jgi:hypothetical protein
MAITTYAGSILSNVKKNKIWTLYSSTRVATVSAALNKDASPASKIKFNNGLYYFINTNGYVYYSTDAKIWNVSSPVNALSGWTDIAYNGTIWVACGTNASTKFHSSTDLITWTSRTSNITTTGSLFQIDWIPAFSRFIVCGTADAAPWNCISSSTDGTTWTSAAVVPTAGSAGAVRGFAYDGTGTIVASASDTVNNGYFSTNGTSWTSININAGIANSYKPIYLPGNVNRFINSSYSQTSASVATAWNTAPYSSYLNVRNMHYGLSVVNDRAHADLGINTTDNVAYAWQPYNDISGSVKIAELITLDMTNPTIQQFTTGTSFEYHLPVLYVEPLPSVNSSKQLSLNYTECAFGWANGIFIWVTFQFNQMNIWSTAT